MQCARPCPTPSSPNGGQPKRRAAQTAETQSTSKPSKWWTNNKQCKMQTADQQQARQTVGNLSKQARQTIGNLSRLSERWVNSNQCKRWTDSKQCKWANHAGNPNGRSTQPGQTADQQQVMQTAGNLNGNLLLLTHCIRKWNIAFKRRAMQTAGNANNEPWNTDDKIWVTA